jgi:hypothetical protein
MSGEIRKYLENHVDPILQPLISALVLTRPENAADVRKELTRLIALQEQEAGVVPYPRLCLSDCDGTLLRTDRENPIGELTLKTLQAYRKAGGIFCIITGRPWAVVGKVVKHLPGAIDYAFCNGACTSSSLHSHLLFITRPLTYLTIRCWQMATCARMFGKGWITLRL